MNRKAVIASVLMVAFIFGMGMAMMCLIDNATNVTTITPAETGPVGDIGVEGDGFDNISSPFYERVTPDGQKLWCFDRYISLHNPGSISTWCISQLEGTS